MPPMPPRVSAIKRAIIETLDFSCLRNGGELAVGEWARTFGANGNALIITWQQAGLTPLRPWREALAAAFRTGGFS